MSYYFAILTVWFLVGLLGCATKSSKNKNPQPAPAKQDGAPNSVPGASESDPSRSAATPPLNENQFFDTSKLNHCVAKDLEKNRVKVTNYDVLVTKEEREFKLSSKVESRTVLGINPDQEGQEVGWTLPPDFSLQEPMNARSDKQGVVSMNVLRDLSQDLAVVCTTATAKGTSGIGRVFSIKSSVPIFVVDIDEVISDLPEIQVPLRSIKNSPVIQGAPEALMEISKTHLIVYLSARDDALLNHTRVWLNAKGFPSGPTFVWDWKAKNRFGFSRTKQGAFKTQFLIDLKKRFPNIKGGIGNRPHDASAYLSAGVQPWIIRAKEEPSKFAKGTRFVTQWQEVPKALTQ